MKILLCQIFLISFWLATPQNVTVKGQILDAHTKKPLPYVNILMLSHKTGTSTDENGDFIFKTDSSFLNAPVRLTSIGYKNKIIKLSDLQDRTVVMETSVNSLNEVFLYNIKDNQHITLNPFKGKDFVGLGNFSGGSYPSALARYYAKPTFFTNDCFLKGVVVFFYATDIMQSEMPAKFRLRILGVKPDGSPGKDILTHNLVVEKPRNRYRIKIDLLKYKIPIPKNGFFVAVEHLFIPENKFTEIKNFRINDTLVYRNVKLEKYAPIFRGVLEESGSAYNSYYESITGWKKMNNLDNSNELLEGKIPAPAFRVIISN